MGTRHVSEAAPRVRKSNSWPQPPPSSAFSIVPPAGRASQPVPRILAAVHKANPCAKEAKTPSEDAIGGTSQQGAAATAAAAAAAAAVLPLATFDFVATGGPAEFAWGAADAAGSVISSAADMTDVIHLLLGVGGVGPVSSDPLISRAVVEELMTGQVGR